MMSIAVCTRVSALALGVAVALAAPTGPAASAEFYQGKTFSIYVGFPPGGGYDTNTRALARHLGDHIPGKPTVVVKTLTGAGSQRLIDYLYFVAPKDGTSMGTFDHGLIPGPLLKPDKIKYDSRKLTWIGSIAKGADICITWHTSPVKTLADMLGKPVSLGASGTEDHRYIQSNLLRTMFGAKSVKPVTGYAGSADIWVAMERGEIDGDCGEGWSVIKGSKSDWLTHKQINIPVQFTTERHPDLPNVPSIVEAAKTPEQKSVLELLLADQLAFRPYASSPAIPQDRRDTLRKAFMDTMKDPGFLQDAAKTKIDVSPLTGEQLEAVVAKIYQTPAAVIESAKKYIH